MQGRQKERKCFGFFLFFLIGVCAADNEEKMQLVIV